MLMTELTEQISTMGQEALVLLQQFLVRQITSEELQSKLQAMDASTLLDRHWGLLTHHPEAAPALEILQLLAFLPEHLPYQVARYGASSLAEDRDQLISALSRLVRIPEVG